MADESQAGKALHFLSSSQATKKPTYISTAVLSVLSQARPSPSFSLWSTRAHSSAKLPILA